VRSELVEAKRLGYPRRAAFARHLGADVSPVEDEDVERTGDYLWKERSHLERLAVFAYFGDGHSVAVKSRRLGVSQYNYVWLVNTTLAGLAQHLAGFPVPERVSPRSAPMVDPAARISRARAVRLVADTVGLTRNCISHALGRAIRARQLRFEYDDHLRFGDLAAWACSRWPGRFDHWPRPAIAARLRSAPAMLHAEVAIIPRDLREAYVTAQRDLAALREEVTRLRVIEAADSRRRERARESGKRGGRRRWR
jgi:hypothetical protein